jgi:hypothetical protein
MSAQTNAIVRLPVGFVQSREREDWHAARDEALLAYRIWCSAPGADKGDAYAAYVAAADREAAAAAALAPGAAEA